MGYSYKQEKIIVIMYEYINDKREFFPVSNIPLEKAKFFYKNDEGLFKLMAVSDYVVRTELNEVRLYVTNEDIKENSKKFQIGYEINFKALEYESPLPVLSILVEMYNQLVEDSKTLFNYVKKQCFISDDKSTSLILPSLPNACVWCMGEDGNIFALPVSELYENFDKMVDKVYEDVKKLLLTDLRENTDLLLDELKTLKNKLTEELEEYKDSLKWEDLLNVPATFPSTWATVSGKPTIFPTNWTNVADKPTVFASNWANVADKPSTFPTTWATVANKPATFPPAAGTITGNLTVTGVFVCNNDVTAFSDIRLKTNITQLTNALGKLDMINGYNFEYKDRAGEKQVGVIAQEVQTVLPEAVKLTERVFNGEKMLAVNEIKIVPLLIEAIKELKREVDKLKGGKE